MTDNNDNLLKYGLGVGLVGAVASFAAGLDQCNYPHSSVIHHGLLGCLLVAGGLILRNDFLTPALVLTGVGMAASDLGDFPQWLDVGVPVEYDGTKTY